MGKFKIKVNIELVECDSDTEQGKLIEKDGSFMMTIDEMEASNIDKCESSLLKTAHPAIRKVLSTHLENLSKKKLLKKRKPASK